MIEMENRSVVGRDQERGRKREVRVPIKGNRKDPFALYVDRIPVSIPGVILY